MAMVEDAAQQISELFLMIASLKEDIKQLDSPSWTAAEYELKLRTIAEQITQECIKADSVNISKDLAADFLRKGDRKSTRQIAVLLARRKTALNKLEEMGAHVDRIKDQPHPHT